MLCVQQCINVNATAARVFLSKFSLGEHLLYIYT
jgi:hypothetical protein